MIVRLWRGRTRLSLADAYTRFLTDRAIPDYRSTAGNLGALVLRHDNDVVHFRTVSYWDSEHAIRAFSGYYPEDDHFLLEKKEFVDQYTVASRG
jgi:heme-degrading monooxygenase HmoA